MLDTVVISLHVLTQLILSTPFGVSTVMYPCFPEEETEAQRGKLTYPRTHSKYVARPRIILGSFVALSMHVPPEMSSLLHPCPLNGSFLLTALSGDLSMAPSQCHRSDLDAPALCVYYHTLQ